jgi:hypothetical protein
MSKKFKPKVKVKKKEEDNFDFMKTTKDNMLNVIRDKTILPIINNLVINSNKIVIHAYQFLKLYLIHLYENNKDLPLLDKEYICDIFKVITKRKCGTGGYTDKNMPSQLRELTNFYNNFYHETICDNEILYYDKMSYILAYEAIDMITNINNNIQEHFIDHLNKFINLTFDVKKKADEITKNNKDKIIRKQLHNELYTEIRKVKNDLINFREFKSDEKYHSWITEHKKILFGNKTSFDENNIYYDIKSNTKDYLKSMFYILIEFEKMNEIRIKNDEKQIRLFNVVPLRTNIISKNICIDSCALISNFLGDEPTKDYLKKYKKEKLQYDLWNRYFKLNTLSNDELDKRKLKNYYNKSFRKNKYTFNFMIRTDGISICIIFIRVDKNGKPLPKTIQNKNNKEDEDISYIEKATITEQLKSKKIVAADPNMSDLIYCGSKNKDGNLETFRYTQNQRRLETRLKKYNKIIDKVNKKTKINDKTIKEHETVLSKLNSKTCNYDKFKEYIIEKNKLNITLFDHYQQTFFRKFKLNRFINTQKSESKLVKNFSKKFGSPKDVVYVMGDFDKGGYNMKGKEPIICKKFRRIFRNAGYETYLVNEHKTSITCSCCHNELESFLERPSKKPKKKGKIEPVWGLLRCKSVTPMCKVIHNRDKNAVQNMLHIVDSIFTTGERPVIFCRTINDDDS